MSKVSETVTISLGCSWADWSWALKMMGNFWYHAHLALSRRSNELSHWITHLAKYPPSYWFWEDFLSLEGWGCLKTEAQSSQSWNGFYLFHWFEITRLAVLKSLINSCFCFCLSVSLAEEPKLQNGLKLIILLPQLLSAEVRCALFQEMNKVFFLGI